MLNLFLQCSIIKYMYILFGISLEIKIINNISGKYNNYLIFRR